MKHLKNCAAVVFLVVLCGCASGGGNRYASEQIVVDHEYVQAVNDVSRKSGVRVTWVNPPTKRVPADSEIDR